MRHQFNTLNATRDRQSFLVDLPQLQKLRSLGNSLLNSHILVKLLWKKNNELRILRWNDQSFCIVINEIVVSYRVRIRFKLITAKYSQVRAFTEISYLLGHLRIIFVSRACRSVAGIPSVCELAEWNRIHFLWILCEKSMLIDLRYGSRNT